MSKNKKILIVVPTVFTTKTVAPTEKNVGFCRYYSMCRYYSF